MCRCLSGQPSCARRSVETHDGKLGESLGVVFAPGVWGGIGRGGTNKAAEPENRRSPGRGREVGPHMHWRLEFNPVDGRDLGRHFIYCAGGRDARCEGQGQNENRSAWSRWCSRRQDCRDGVEMTYSCCPEQPRDYPEEHCSGCCQVAEEPPQQLWASSSLSTPVAVEPVESSTADRDVQCSSGVNMACE